MGTRAEDNDALTFEIASPSDFWLHVAGVPGSHVVVRNPESLLELPKEVARRAAELAARHSKARDAQGKVKVHLCRARDVYKPRGSPPGEVGVSGGLTLAVYPEKEP